MLCCTVARNAQQTKYKYLVFERENIGKGGALGMPSGKGGLETIRDAPKPMMERVRRSLSTCLEISAGVAKRMSALKIFFDLKSQETHWQWGDEA